MRFLLAAYLFLCFIFSPSSLAVLLAQGFLLLVVQQRVVLVVTHNLVLIVLQHLSQKGILHQGKMRKKYGHGGFEIIIIRGEGKITVEEPQTS